MNPAAITPPTMNVEFVRAGAGSGKTFYLTRLLAEKLASGAARPSGVIATTVTVKAATELRERARATLLETGRLDLSAAIGQARISTVNSFCGQLVQRLCFELGISPDQSVLPEEDVKRLVAAALESVQTPAQMEQLLAVAGRLGLDEEGVLKTIAKIMEAARANNLSAPQVAAMAARNADAMLACWPQPSGDHTAALLQALDEVLPQLEAVREAGNATGVLANGIESVVQAREALAQGRLPWSEWHKLAGLNCGARQKPIVQAVQDIAKRHPAHNQFHVDVRGYLDLVFGLAAGALDAFAQAKRELGVMDFTDQEVMLLQAVQDFPLVRPR